MICFGKTAVCDYILFVGTCTKSECNSKKTINLTCPSSRPNAVITIDTIKFALQYRSGRMCSEECCSPVSNVDEDCFAELPPTHQYHHNAVATCDSKRQCLLTTPRQHMTFSAPCNNTQRPNHYIMIYYKCKSQQTTSITTATTTISKNTFLLNSRNT